VAITALFSIAVFAIPAGILGWGFESVGEKFQEHRRKKKIIEKIKNNTQTQSEEEEESRYSLRFSTDITGINESETLLCPTCHQPVNIK
jgi:hypothetical protein